jgi:hypothetical protein
MLVDRLLCPVNGKASFYRAYGLAIRSELILPELSKGRGQAIDMDVRLLPVKPPHTEAGAPTAFEFQSGRQLLHWRDVGTFLILGHREIHIDPAPGVDDDIIRLPLLGPVMALFLHQLGKLVLHASAVGVGTRGAVFLGDKQAGKSTTAAALVARGHRLLTDDVLAIDFPATGPSISPGFPNMKLEQALTETILGGINRTSAGAIPGTSKHRLRFGAFWHRKTPPSCIFVLKRGNSAQVHALPPDEALAELLRFSYVWRFGREALEGNAVAAHLRQCAELVRTSRICRLEVPRDLDRLGETLDRIEDELA